MPRGGSRQGKAGRAYSNRTDLNGSLPVTTVPGQPYGAAKQQADAQRTVPMGTPALPPVPDLNSHPSPLPGELPPLTGPSSRPDEPVTHGLPVGPGGGPEVLPINAQPGVGGQYSSARDLIQGLASSTASPSLATLAAYVNGGL